MTKLIIATSVLAAACGGKEEDKVRATAAPTTEVDKKPAPTAPTKPVPTETAPDFTYGYCHVAGSGAVTFDQKTAHTGSSVLNVMQWHTEEMRTKLGFAAEGIILNCLGKDVRLNIVSKQKGGAFPMKPASYKLGKGSAIGVLGTVTHADEKGGLSIVGTDGTLEITAFDSKHIAGKGEITIKTLPAKGDIKLTIDFDMQCRDLSGCPK